MKFNLKLLMVEKGVDRDDVSKATGLNKNLLSAISTGKVTSIKINTIEKLCTYFKVPIEKMMYLLPDEDKKAS